MMMELTLAILLSMNYFVHILCCQSKKFGGFHLDFSPFSSKSMQMSGFSGGSDGKESACKAGDSGQSLGQENPLEKGMACLENPMDRGTQRATVQRGPKESDTTEQLTLAFTIHMKNNVGIFLVFMDFVPIIYFSLVQSLSHVRLLVTP